MNPLSHYYLPCAIITAQRSSVFGRRSTADLIIQEETPPVIPQPEIPPMSTAPPPHHLSAILEATSTAELQSDSKSPSIGGAISDSTPLPDTAPPSDELIALPPIKVSPASPHLSALPSEWGVPDLMPSVSPRLPATANGTPSSEATDAPIKSLRDSQLAWDNNPTFTNSGETPRSSTGSLPFRVFLPLPPSEPNSGGPLPQQQQQQQQQRSSKDVASVDSPSHDDAWTPVRNPLISRSLPGLPPGFSYIGGERSEIQPESPLQEGPPPLLLQTPTPPLSHIRVESAEVQRSSVSLTSSAATVIVHGSPAEVYNPTPPSSDWGGSTPEQYPSTSPREASRHRMDSGLGDEPGISDLLSKSGAAARRGVSTDGGEGGGEVSFGGFSPVVPCTAPSPPLEDHRRRDSAPISPSQPIRSLASHSADASEASGTNMPRSSSGLLLAPLRSTPPPALLSLVSPGSKGGRHRRGISLDTTLQLGEQTGGNEDPMFSTMPRQSKGSDGSSRFRLMSSAMIAARQWTKPAREVSTRGWGIALFESNRKLKMSFSFPAAAIVCHTSMTLSESLSTLPPSRCLSKEGLRSPTLDQSSQSQRGSSEQR